MGGAVVWRGRSETGQPLVVASERFCGQPRAVRPAGGRHWSVTMQSWRRLAVAKRKVLTRVANSKTRNNQVGGVAVLRCNLGCFGTKCFATRSQDTPPRRAMQM